MATALVSFHANGRFITEGDELDATDPLIAGREHLFETPEAETAKPEKAPRARKAAAK